MGTRTFDLLVEDTYFLLVKLTYKEDRENLLSKTTSMQLSNH